MDTADNFPMMASRITCVHVSRFVAALRALRTVRDASPALEVEALRVATLRRMCENLGSNAHHGRGKLGKRRRPVMVCL